MSDSAFLVSLKTASVATIITFLIGVLVARYVAAIRHSGVKSVIDGILTLPMVLPPTVVGFFLLFFFRRQSACGPVFY